MYKINGFADFMKLQEEDCSCFGPAQQQDQHFLAKHKTPPITHPLPIGNPPQQTLDLSVKNGCKKSLKRPPPSQTASLYGLPPQRYIEESSRVGLQISPQKWQQEQGNLQYNQERGERPKNYIQNHEMIGQHRLVFPQANAIHQLQNKMPVNNTLLLSSPHAYQTPPVRISFTTGFANKGTNFSPQIDSPNKIELPHEELPISHHQTQPLPSEEVNNKQKQRQLQKIQSLQNIHNDPEHQANLTELQHSSKHVQFPLSPRRNEGHLSKPTHQSEKKIVSRVSLNCETGKSQLLNLKKMDDVMEICSQAGSEDGSSSDESIVVGRLNEYCSMVEPKGSVGEKSVQSKGAGLTSISSTISHYQFNRRKDDL